ncbi:MAG: hypothetical protein QGH40_12900 [bacterium]|nr:hypothetical protein [bacterium]
MENFVRIMVFENEIEAQVLDSVLKEHDIPHQVWSFHDTAYDGLFQLSKGWGFLLAPEEFRDRINLLYDEVNQAVSPMESTEDTEE